MRAFVRAHEWFFANRDAAASIAMTETGITEDYARRAWEEYTADEIFPRDGDANTAAVQALIEISSLIRAVPIASSLRPTNTSTATISTRRKGSWSRCQRAGREIDVASLDPGHRLWRSPAGGCC